MKGKNLSDIKKTTVVEKRRASPFKIMIGMLGLLVVAAGIFLSQYRPADLTPIQPISLEQKMAHLKSGAPLPQQQASAPQIPWWMAATIFVFAGIQLIPLVLAAGKANAKDFSQRDIRQIEFLVETPLHLGLLGSLLGVCLTQFLTGSLAAPLAYFTTISGILFYLFGRFSILVSLPILKDISE